jgi:hypothetical protein
MHQVPKTSLQKTISRKTKHIKVIIFPVLYAQQRKKAAFQALFYLQYLKTCI